MYLENHSHIRKLWLYYTEKGWKVAQSFRDLSNFSAKEQSAKAKDMGSAPKSAIFISRYCYGLSRQPFAGKMAG
ncbi:unnamed protein product [Haemonchus placei]|uniref:Integrase n=1 Tax=Haemonchus placei TaxID=6290 RepID=A0A0N4W6L0_HAEPC|nr:unnamed protein product [Haemonchus placei]